MPPPVRPDPFAVAARCTEVDTGARNVDHILTQTLLPELSGRLLERMADAQSFRAVHVSLDPQGRFNRQLFLGESLDPDGISANYDQGVLTLHIPVAERAKPRKVEVSAGASEAVEVAASAA